MEITLRDRSFTECVINNKRVEYHACSSGDLEEAKKSYDNFKYIGSGKVYFVNGVKNQDKETLHFFVRDKKKWDKF